VVSGGWTLAGERDVSPLRLFTRELEPCLYRRHTGDNGAGYIESCGLLLRSGSYGNPSQRPDEAIRQYGRHPSVTFCEDQWIGLIHLSRDDWDVAEEKAGEAIVSSKGEQVMYRGAIQRHTRPWNGLGIQPLVFACMGRQAQAGGYA
jgi:hypothetical protein